MAVKLLERMLADVSWRNKIIGLACLFTFGTVFIGAIGAYVVLDMSTTLNRVLQESNARVDAALNARFAVLEMAKAQAELIAASDHDALRASAVAAIKASAVLDENIQRLDKTLHRDPAVVELVQLVNEIKPSKLKLIMAARKNDDELAMAISQQMAESVERVESLSHSVVQHTRAGVTLAMERQVSRGYQFMVILGAFIALIFILSLAASFYAAALVTKPVLVLEKGMAALATGDLRFEVPHAGKDEVGRMVKAMACTVNDLKAMLGKIQGSADVLSAESENLSGRADEISVVSQRLHDSVTTIRTEAETVMTTSSGAVNELENATKKARQSADMTEVTAHKIADSADGFQRFQEHMELTAQQTRELARTAEQITSITNTIRDISGQTNLLALNAAIEAARAGDHGRGFAVVADEVRNLATRTDTATSEISTLVEAISGNVGRTVELLEGSVVEARSNIEALQQIAEETAGSRDQAMYLYDTMHEMVAVMSEQENAVGGINSTASALFNVSEETNRQTALLRELSRGLNGAAADLGTVVQRFKL